MIAPSSYVIIITLLFRLLLLVQVIKIIGSKRATFPRKPSKDSITMTVTKYSPQSNLMSRIHTTCSWCPSVDSQGTQPIQYLWNILENQPITWFVVIRHLIRIRSLILTILYWTIMNIYVTILIPHSYKEKRLEDVRHTN